MNSVLANSPYCAGQLFQNTHCVPSRVGPSATAQMTSRKRKADGSADESMSVSPERSLFMGQRTLAQPASRHSYKRIRSNMCGRPLDVKRTLETMKSEDMRKFIESLCKRHSDVEKELIDKAPRPTQLSVLQVLHKYKAALEEKYPVGSRNTEYAYNRVKEELVDFAEAIKDFCPNFLPPHEDQVNVSLEFLDNVTGMLHEIPTWNTFFRDRHKMELYEALSQAWSDVIKEAGQKGAGMLLKYNNWDVKIKEHNKLSEGKLQKAVDMLTLQVDWIDGSRGVGNRQRAAFGFDGFDDLSSPPQELLNGIWGPSATVGT